MKKYLVSLLILMSLQACSQEDNNSKTTQLLSVKNHLPQYPVEKQIIYIVHLNTKTPYELYLDDMLIDWETESGFSKTVKLNPYLLENGIHTLKIRFFPREDSQNGLIKPKDIVYDQDVKWNMYFIKLQKDPTDPLGYAGNIDYDNSQLPIVAPPTDVPVWEQEFKVEVKDLPYKLEGWSNGEDLSQLDPLELEREVVAFYTQLREFLNNGKIIEFMELNVKNDFESVVSMYGTPEQYERSVRGSIEALTKKCIGNMLPISDYAVKLYANGKVARLEIANEKYGRWGALRSESKKYGKMDLGIMIYRPKGTKEFIIIRHNK